MGINRAIHFTLKVFQIGHDQCLYRNRVVHERGEDGILKI